VTVGSVYKLSYKVAGLGVLVACSWLVYALIYHPFIFEYYIPRSFRLGVEGFLISLLLIISIKQDYFKNVIWLFPLLIVLAVIFFLDIDNFSSIASLAGKVFIFLFSVDLFIKNQSARQVCLSMWKKLWLVFAILAILGFVGNLIGLIPFQPMNFYRELGFDSDSRYYLHNPLFGNLTHRSFMGFMIDRTTGFMFEPAYLAFFFGFNVIAAKDLFDSQSEANNFVWVNFLGGVTTLSYSFLFLIIFFILLRSVANLSRSQISSLLIIPMISSLIFYFVYSDIIANTSASTRLVGLEVILDVMRQNSLQALFWGNGVGFTTREYGTGIDSAWLALIVERGMVLFLLLFSMFVKFTKSNLWILFYVFMYSLVFNMLLDPICLLGVALRYAAVTHRSSSQDNFHAI